MPTKKRKKSKKNRVVGGGGGEVNRKKQLNRAFITKKHVTRLNKVK